MPQVSDLIAKIRRRINDCHAAEFGDDELISYLNEGLSYLELTLAADKIPFNVRKIEAVSSQALLPKDLIAIYKVTHNGGEIFVKAPYGSEKGRYYIMENIIYLPFIPSDIYYCASFPRLSITGEIEIYPPLIQYLYEFAVIKALGRIEFDTRYEENALAALTANIKKVMLNKDGAYKLGRFRGYGA